ncbi:hypothetical protein LOZ53_000787 [Ophidiomyces ophidiicola]|nr:hypothetical protein LOZ53_000787 [Ophidiomyces ophidiicola]
MAESFQCPASSHARLSQLAAEAGVPVDSQPPLHKKELAFFIVESDKRESENLMKRIRQQIFSSKSHTFRRSPSRRGFVNHELHAAIETLIQDDGPIGVLACLLDKVREAKAKRKLFKLFEDKELDLSNFLRFATEKRRLDMMDLLAPHVDLSALNTSLQSAATMLDIDCVTILLRHGADPNFCQSAFLTIVQNNNLQLAQIFLRSPKTLSTSCLDDALPLAVSNRSLQLSVALLKQGANADLGTAFETVVRNGTPDFVAAFVSAKRSPSPVSLDRALGIILSKFWVIGPEQRFIVEILLCGGANGGNTTEALIRAVVTDDCKLASLVISYRDTVFYDPTQPIIKALETKNERILNILLADRLDPQCASAVLSKFLKIPSSISPSKILSMASTLVERGASGESLHECLIDAVRIKDTSLVKLLVHHGASTDYRGGAALDLAISSESSETFSELLVGKPSQETCSRCFRLLPKLSEKYQFQWASSLLEAGARGDDVNKTLARLVLADDGMWRHQFIDALVKHGADVNVDNGYCIQEAAKSGDIVSLSLLLKGNVSELSLSKGVVPASKLRNRELRLTIIDLLLSAGASGPLVHERLVELIQECPADIILISLFLQKGKADVNFDGGAPIHQACQLMSLELLELFLQYQPSGSTLSSAFHITMRTQDPYKRYSLCAKILAAGIDRNILDGALIVEQQSSSKSLKIIKLFLDHGADVNSSNGIVFRRAIIQSDEEQLTLLASRALSTQTIFKALELIVQTKTARRYEMARILLKPTDCYGADDINHIFHYAVTSDIRDIRFLELLLQHGASLDYQRGLAVRKSIENEFLDVFELFLKQPLTQETLNAAFETCFLMDPSLRVLYVTMLFEAGYMGSGLDEALLDVVKGGPSNTGMIMLLLKHGASPYFANCQPLIEAAMSLDCSILSLLLNNAPDKSAVAYVFKERITANTSWLSDAGLSSIKLLLGHGAFGDALNVALIMAIEAMEFKPEAEQFVELFLQFKASVDFRDGCALQTAITRGKLSLVRKLVQANPSDMTLMIGLSCVLNLDIHEDMVLDIIGILCKGNLDIRALNTAWHLNEPKEKSPLFLCIRRWPCSTRVLMKLLTSGMDANESILHLIPGEYDSEHISLLQWAILQRAGPDVIECLMKYGAEPNFQSTKTWKTPIIMAAISCDPKLVLMLIQHGADPSGCDKTGQTALLYACKNNQIQIMRHLLSAGATANDGSLHEASQDLNVKAIKLLISYGHNPNFPSMLHDGRSPLATLCFNCSDTTSSISKLRQVLDLLILSKADLRASSLGKPLLLHAIDNQKSCVLITTALLASGMWKLVNDECNLYTVKDFVYSPSTYITKQLQLSPNHQSSQLLQVLKAHGCKDAFYRLSGPQPPDMVNAPLEIVAEEKRRQARLKYRNELDEDHQMKLRQNEDFAGQQTRQMMQLHNLKIQLDRELADEREARTERLSKQQLYLESESAAQQARFAEQNRTRELEHSKIIAQRDRVRITQKEQVCQMEGNLADKKWNMESLLIKELDAAKGRQYERDRELLKLQQSTLMGRQINRDFGVNSGSVGDEHPAQKRLTFAGDELD